MRRAPRAIRRVLALRNNAFEAELASVSEDGRAITLHVFVEPDAGSGLGHNRCERGLADLKRVAPQVVAVQFDEVEGIEKDASVSALVPDEIERGNAVLVASNRLAIDDAGARAQPGRRTVNTEPLPCSLVTVTSPPIMRASLREMARPSPVPP